MSKQKAYKPLPLLQGAEPFRKSFPGSESAEPLLGSASGTTSRILQNRRKGEAVVLLTFSLPSVAEATSPTPCPCVYRKLQLPPSYPSPPCLSSLGLVMAFFFGLPHCPDRPLRFYLWWNNFSPFNALCFKYSESFLLSVRSWPRYK